MKLAELSLINGIDKRNETIINLWNSGEYTQTQIAETLRLPSRSVVSGVLNRARKTGKVKRSSWVSKLIGKKEIEKIVKEVDDGIKEGLSVKQVSEKLNVPLNRVESALRRRRRETGVGIPRSRKNPTKVTRGKYIGKTTRKSHEDHLKETETFLKSRPDLTSTEDWGSGVPLRDRIGCAWPTGYLKGVHLFCDQPTHGRTYCKKHSRRGLQKHFS